MDTCNDLVGLGICVLCGVLLSLHGRQSPLLCHFSRGFQLAEGTRSRRHPLCQRHQISEQKGVQHGGPQQLGQHEVMRHLPDGLRGVRRDRGTQM